jgi:hypothetical protein
VKVVSLKLVLTIIGRKGGKYYGMNSIHNPPEFNREVLVKLDNGFFVVGQYHHLYMDGKDFRYFKVGKGIVGNDPHMTGKPVAWCYLPE